MTSNWAITDAVAIFVLPAWQAKQPFVIPAGSINFSSTSQFLFHSPGLKKKNNFEKNRIDATPQCMSGA
jgi:hypothetical protein